VIATHDLFFLIVVCFSLLLDDKQNVIKFDEINNEGKTHLLQDGKKNIFLYKNLKFDFKMLL